MNNQPAEEFTLEADSELRIEVETKNKKITVEVSSLLKILSDDYFDNIKQSTQILNYNFYHLPYFSLNPDLPNSLELNW